MKETDWIYDKPPITEKVTGEGSIVWYEVLYVDGEIGISCWWHSGWYCNSNWASIVAYRPSIKDDNDDGNLHRS